MDTIGAFEAKTHLSSLLERVAQGESFTITRFGRPVAQLVPVQHRDPERIKGRHPPDEGNRRRPDPRR